ncbi:uncharacterized protein LOC142633665 [Castanea sativa]|uniref:uncharacterized protein LOC142633665 n=1 Tax=Castanea sativa TaxID=21020 RepID=UPI003F64FB2C
MGVDVKSGWMIWIHIHYPHLDKDSNIADIHVAVLLINLGSFQISLSINERQWQADLQLFLWRDGLDLGFMSGCTSTNPKSYECVSVLVVSFGCIWLQVNGGLWKV